MKYFHIGRGAVLTSLSLHYLALVQVLCGLSLLLIPSLAQWEVVRVLQVHSGDTKTQ